MRRLVVAVVALLWAPVVQAGVGTSVGIGTGWSGWAGFGSWGDVVNVGFVPSLDYRADPLIIQFHVLEFAGALLDTQDVYIGANLYFDTGPAPLAGDWQGVIQPGVSLDVIGDPFLVAVAGEARVGMEAASKRGFGVYVVPSLGVWVGDGDSGFITGGTLQVSAWFGAGGGGGGGGGSAPE